MTDSAKAVVLAEQKLIDLAEMITRFTPQEGLAAHSVAHMIDMAESALARYSASKEHPDG